MRKLLFLLILVTLFAVTACEKRCECYVTIVAPPDTCEVTPGEDDDDDCD
jgi:hypothetical protein